jgi:hypothetical protein
MSEINIKIIKNHDVHTHQFTFKEIISWGGGIKQGLVCLN